MIATMNSSGLIVNNLIFDAQLHRVPTIAKPNQKDGWYVAFPNGKSVLYGDWRTGAAKTYSGQAKPFSRDDALALKKARDAYKKAKLVKQQASANECQAQWKNACNVITHPYLTNKRIKPYGIRVDKHKNLLVPIFDYCGELINLQYIDVNGSKRFKKGARVTGGYLQIGPQIEQGTLLICEGYATGCSLHEATGFTVLVAFNAGNLESVCVGVKKEKPSLKVVICADNDHQTEIKTGHNVGLEKAHSIAEKNNVKVLWPKFDSDNSGSDFNDIHCQFSLSILRTMLLPRLKGDSL